MNLTKMQRKFIAWPLLYRLKAVDYFLPGFAGMALAGLLFPALFPPALRQPMFIASFVILALVLNRLAFLLAGRTGVHGKKLQSMLLYLLENDRMLDVRRFTLDTGIPLSLVRKNLDQVVAENFWSGYLVYSTLRFYLADEPVAGKLCPVCKSTLSEQNIFEKHCGECGSFFYI